MADQPATPAKKKPVTLLKVFGCMVLAILLVAGIVIPGILGSSRASNARSASTSLKTLTSAQADFRANDRDWNRVNDFWVGDVSRLYYFQRDGEPLKLIELSVASADGAPLEKLPQPDSKAGYLYVAMKIDETGTPYDQGGNRNTSKFAFCAYPEEYKPEAWYRRDVEITTWTFIVNEDGIIWRKDTHAAPVTTWPKNLWGEGWTKLD